MQKKAFAFATQGDLDRVLRAVRQWERSVKDVGKNRDRRGRFPRGSSSPKPILVKLTEDAYTTMVGTATANKCDNEGNELSPTDEVEVDVSSFAAPSFGYAYIGHYLWVLPFGDNYRPTHGADLDILGKTDGSINANTTGTVSVYFDGDTETDTGVNLTGRNGKTINTTISSNTFVDLTLKKGVWIIDGRRCS